MMEKRTLVPVQKRSFSIDYSSNIVLLGSCFSSAMGSRLTEMKFNAFTNPFGTVFNPVSIAKLLKFEKVNPQKVTAAGRSEYVPIATNETPEGKATNRRTEIIITPNLSELVDFLEGSDK